MASATLYLCHMHLHVCVFVFLCVCLCVYICTSLLVYKWWYKNGLQPCFPKSLNSEGRDGASQPICLRAHSTSCCITNKLPHDSWLHSWRLLNTYCIYPSELRWITQLGKGREGLCPSHAPLCLAWLWFSPNNFPLFKNWYHLSLSSSPAFDPDFPCSLSLPLISSFGFLLSYQSLDECFSHSDLRVLQCVNT